MFFQTARDEQNLSLAIAAGSLTGLAGAVAWAFITARTSSHYSLIAVVIGFAVGWVFRVVGKGMDISFSIVAAVIALLSVAFGDLLATCAMLADANEVTFFDVFWSLNWDTAVELATAQFSYVDILFYGVAAYFAFRNAPRRFGDDELAPLRRAS